MIMRMEILTLLNQAKSAGLSIEVQGDQLVMRGPKRAAAIAQELGRQKAAVLAALSTKAFPGVVERQDTKADTDAGRKWEENQSASPCTTVNRLKEQFGNPSGTTSTTITHEGKFYEVSLKSGMWFFRRSPDAGWTACSDGFAKIVEEQRRPVTPVSKPWSCCPDSGKENPSAHA